MDSREESDSSKVRESDRPGRTGPKTSRKAVPDEPRNAAVARPSASAREQRAATFNDRTVQRRNYKS